MNYQILTETELFRLIPSPKPDTDWAAAYNEFVKSVIDLCHGYEELHYPLFALTYAETELQYHVMQNRIPEKGRPLASAPDNVYISKTHYISKALAFIRKMLKYLTIPVPPLTSAPHLRPSHEKAIHPAFRWTANAVDLVEVIYALDEMGCINNGEAPIGELASFFYSLFGIEAKECYRYYTDIKHRKNESRTYFIDKMQARLNRRMQLDDEKEKMRR